MRKGFTQKRGKNGWVLIPVFVLGLLRALVVYGGAPPSELEKLRLSHPESSVDFFSPNGDGVIDDVLLSAKSWLRPTDNLSSSADKNFKHYIKFWVVITDAKGVITYRTLEGKVDLPFYPAPASGFYEGPVLLIKWDGKDDSGAVVPDGSYRFGFYARWIRVHLPTGKEKVVDEATVVGVVNVDTVPPKIDILSPQDGSIFNTGFSVLVRYSDEFSGIDSSTFNFTMDGTDLTPLFGSITGTEATCDLKKEELIEGRWRLNASIRDVAGNPSSDSISIIVDFTPPQINILKPLEGELLHTSTPDIEIAYTDNLSGIDPLSVKILLNDADFTSHFIINSDKATFKKDIKLSDGFYTLRVDVADRAANLSSASRSFQILLYPGDIEPPFVYIEYPEPKEELYSTLPEIAVAYTDDVSGVDLNSIVITLDGYDITSNFEILPDRAVFKRNFELLLGPHLLEVNLKDLSGKPGHAEVHFRVVGEFRYYSLDGYPVNLSLLPTYVALKLSLGVSPSSIFSQLQPYGVESISSKPDPMGYYWVKLIDGADPYALQNLPDEVSGVEFVGYLFHRGSWTLTTFNQIYVKFKEGVGLDQIGKLNEAYGASIVERDCCIPNAYHIKIVKAKNAIDVLNAANEYYVQDIVSYAAPDLDLYITSNLPSVSAAMMGQWYLDVIHAQEGWNEAYGVYPELNVLYDPKVAVFGTGIDTSHPAFSSRTLTGYSVFPSDIPQPDNVELIENSISTAFAGVMAASWLDDYRGISKNAWIVPVQDRVFWCSEIGPCGYVTSDKKVKEAINWAVNTTMVEEIAFPVGFERAYPPQVIEGIKEIAFKGKDGRGVAVILPSGDGEGRIKAYTNPVLSLPDIIGVGALDENYNVPQWGNYALEKDLIDVWAPGTNILAPDIVGGYGASSGDYGTFNSSSMASAIIAGEAALVLSIRPYITPGELLGYLRDTGSDIEIEVVRYVEGSPMIISWIIRMIIKFVHILQCIIPAWNCTGSSDSLVLFSPSPPEEVKAVQPSAVEEEYGIGIIGGDTPPVCTVHSVHSIMGCPTWILPPYFLPWLFFGGDYFPRERIKLYIKGIKEKVRISIPLRYRAWGCPYFYIIVWGYLPWSGTGHLHIDTNSSFTPTLDADTRFIACGQKCYWGIKCIRVGKVPVCFPVEVCEIVCSRPIDDLSINGILDAMANGSSSPVDKYREIVNSNPELYSELQIIGREYNLSDPNLMNRVLTEERANFIINHCEKVKAMTSDEGLIDHMDGVIEFVKDNIGNTYEKIYKKMLSQMKASEKGGE